MSAASTTNLLHNILSNTNLCATSYDYANDTEHDAKHDAKYKRHGRTSKSTEYVANTAQILKADKRSFMDLFYLSGK